MALIFARIMVTMLAGCGGIATVFMSIVGIKDSIKDSDFYGIFLFSICILMALALIMMGVLTAFGLLF